MKLSLCSMVFALALVACAAASRSNGEGDDGSAPDVERAPSAQLVASTAFGAIVVADGTSGEVRMRSPADCMPGDVAVDASTKRIAAFCASAASAGGSVHVWNTAAGALTPAAPSVLTTVPVLLAGARGSFVVIDAGGGDAWSMFDGEGEAALGVPVSIDVDEDGGGATVRALVRSGGGFELASAFVKGGAMEATPIEELDFEAERPKIVRVTPLAPPMVVDVRGARLTSLSLASNAAHVAEETFEGEALVDAVGMGDGRVALLLAPHELVVLEMDGGGAIGRVARARLPDDVLLPRIFARDLAALSEERVAVATPVAVHAFDLDTADFSLKEDKNFDGGSLRAPLGALP